MSLVLAHNKRDSRILAQKLAFAAVALIAAAVVIPILGLFGFIAFQGASKVNWDFLTKNPSALDASGGIFPAIIGTAWLIVFTILLAMPLGVIGAVYLTEYGGRSKLVTLVRAAIVNLAGVPSIVHGLFGLGCFVFFVGGSIDRIILRTSKPVWGQPCLLWGACTLAVVILPIVIKSTEEALAAVPKSFREGSQALGATKWETIRRIILPAALPEILTGAVLGIGRATGETAPVMLTCAASFKPTLPQGLGDQAMLLPYHLYFVVTQVPNAKMDTKSAIALVLISFVAASSIVVILLRSKFKKARKW
ncbi:MAG: phosphate ABC transporter permease PstA [Chthonomonadaceae bacterium]|nr:phosphate ABC transporter permease PstA [Chthonomonadaceae bacterium]